MAEAGHKAPLGVNGNSLGGGRRSRRCVVPNPTEPRLRTPPFGVSSRPDVVEPTDRLDAVAPAWIAQLGIARWKEFGMFQDKGDEILELPAPAIGRFQKPRLRVDVGGLRPPEEFRMSRVGLCARLPRSRDDLGIGGVCATDSFDSLRMI